MSEEGKGEEEVTPPQEDDNVSADQSLETQWEGCIPIQVTLAPTSISSPTIPPSIHALVPRNSYLHVGLQQVVHRLHPFAPVMTISTGFQAQGLLQVTEPDAGAEGGDKDDGDEPQGPSAVTTGSENRESLEAVYPPCWFQDTDTELPLKWHLPISVLFDTRRDRSIPWRLLLHFTNYPAEILPFDSTQQIFQHSLKQALTITTGLTKKTAMQLNKESHQRLWQAIVTADYSMFRRVDLPRSPSAAIAVRLVVADDRTISTIQHHVPIIDSAVDHHKSVALSALLREWLPVEESTEDAKTTLPRRIVRICGVEMEEEMLRVPMERLWRYCRSADQFLYVVVVLQ